MNTKEVAILADDGEFHTIVHTAFTFETLPKSIYRSDETEFKKPAKVVSTGVVQRNDHNETLTLTTGWYISARIRYKDIIDIV